MIKELNKQEIKTVEDYIQLIFKDNPEYKYYFTGEPKKNYSDRGFLIGNNNFYIDIEVINGISFIGMCKLQTTKNNYLTDIITLFERIYKEYGVIGIWRVEKNLEVLKLHEHIKNRFKKRGDIVREIKGNGIVAIVIQKGGMINDLKK